jgi:hypothetical protein
MQGIGTLERRRVAGTLSCAPDILRTIAVA